MNRREFLGTAALAAAAGMQGRAAEKPSVNTFPELNGPEFKGMEGAFVPIFTPYTKDDKVNGDMVGKMVERLLKAGVKGFYVGGGTGEHVLLSLAERKYLAEAAISAVNKRAKVIIHVGCTYTEDSVKLAQHAEKAGADWIASLGPLVFGQNFDASYYHYSRIAGATALPMMIYCWYRDLVPDRERKFYEIPNLKGLKYTGRDFWSVQEMRKMVDKEIVCFVGDDPHLLSGLAMNKLFSGGIGTTYNFTPEDYVGDVIGDLSSRRGRIEGMDMRANARIIRAYVPLVSMFGYATDLRSRTSGRANYSMQFDHYEQTPAEVSEKVLQGRGRSE